MHVVALLVCLFDSVSAHAYVNVCMYVCMYVSNIVHGKALTFPEMRFLLVYDTLKTSDEGVKNLFMEMYDLYTKAALNPFYDPNTKLVSKSFGMKAMQIGKRYL